MASTNGESVPAIAKITIILLPTGQIQASSEGADRNVFNMMMARAKQDLIPKFIAVEAQ